MWNGIIGTTMVVMLILPLSAGGTVAVGETSSGPGAWLTGWSNRIQLTIHHSEIDAVLQDFPVLVHLSTSSGTNAADMSAVFESLSSYSNRNRIAVTDRDGRQQLYVEIEGWDAANKDAWLWVRVPTISKTEDSVLYLYYDPVHAANTAWVGDAGSQTAENVWEANFAGVWHLNQSGNTTAGAFRDSTSGRHDGTGGGGDNGPRQVPAIVGMGQDFDASNHITIPDSDVFSVTLTGQMTVSLWVSPSVPDFETAADHYVNLMGKGDVDRYEWSFVFYDKDGTDRSQRISFYIDNPEGGISSGAYTQAPIALNDWVYIAAELKAGYVYIYRNGILASKYPYTGPDAYVDVHPKNGTAPVRIGTRNLTSSFQGRIDEVRISDTARSDAWVQASYLSEGDSLILFTPDEPPKLAPIAARSVIAGQTVSFIVTADAPVGRPIEYSAFNLPPGAQFDPLTRTFGWTPDLSQVGTYAHIGFEATTGGLTDSENVALTVVGPEESRPPIAGPPSTNLLHISHSLALVGALIVAAALLLLTMLAMILRKQRQGAGR